MSINELPQTPKPAQKGILDRLVMHGVDQAQPKKMADAAGGAEDIPVWTFKDSLGTSYLYKLERDARAHAMSMDLDPDIVKPMNADRAAKLRFKVR